MIKKIGLVKIIVSITVFLLLVASVYAVFNGVVEIAEETLGNIVNFLSNPVSFINDFARNTWNTVVDATPDILGGKYKFEDSEKCMFFLSSDMVDQLAENLSEGGILTENSGYLSGDMKKAATGAGMDSKTNVSDAIVSKAKTTGSAGSGYCLAWVDNVYERAGLNVNRVCCAYRDWELNGISTDINSIPIGAAVYGTGSGRVHCGSCGGRTCGHVGIYIGNGKVMENISSGVVTTDLSKWATSSWQPGIIEGHQGWLGWGWADGNKTRGLSGDSTIKTASKTTKTEETNDDTNEENTGDSTDNQENNEKDSENKDYTMLKGSLDLDATGLTKDTLRDMILASYLTQATTDTVVGIEIPEDEVDPILKGALEAYRSAGTVPGAEIIGNITNFASSLIKKLTLDVVDVEHKTGNGWVYLKFGNYFYYRVESDGEVKYYIAEEGIIQILNGDDKKVKCYSEETFNKYYELFNDETGERSYRDDVFYTVPEIGKIKIVSGQSNNGEYTFSTEEINYAQESEIQSAMIPLELLVDFLNISASSDFMSAFEELVRDQDIVFKLVPTITTTNTETTTLQEGTASANVDVTAYYEKNIGMASDIQASSTTTSSSAINTGYSDSKSGDIELNPIRIESSEETTETSMNYSLILQKANTWFMKAEREVKPTTNVVGPDTTETKIEGKTVEESGTGAFTSENAGSLSGELNGQLTVTNVINIFGGAPIGYYINSQKSNLNVNSTRLELYEGTKTVTTTTTTETYTKGTLQYDDNTDAFLGLWTNKDGIYHRYKDSFGNENPDALFEPEGKKVGYHDLYEDEKSYVGDLFVNADEMLFQLLELSENTQKHSHTMKYILSKYTGKDYGVTDFDTLLRLLGIKTNSIQDYNVNTRSSSGSKLKIVATDDGKSAEQNLIDGVKSISNSAYKQYCMVYVDRGYCKELIKLQDKYGVNPAWVIAQSYYETQCGTTGSGPAPVNNWWGWDVYGGHTHSFPSPVECFDKICWQLADGDGYFREGKETIDDILDVWCPAHTDEYPTVCKEIFRDILTGAGVKISGANGEFVEIAERLWKEQIWHSGKSYGGSGVPCTGSTIDCSSFVSWVIYEYGYKEFGGGQTVTQTFLLTNWKAKYGWEEIPLAPGEDPINQLQPGDLIVRDPGDNNGHITLVVEVLQAEDRILCYDCGNSKNWQERSINGEPIDKSYMLHDSRRGKVIRVTAP